ncbi:MAG TPA: NAD(P)-binding domain-containing protein, partial [Candidatus Acidoferrum sp.]|nr:NAD(P)-binding domain-containing protein [Candidatus Acidoferrum sp.]
MQIGMVGLGRMGANMARRMARAGAQVSAFDLSPMARSALAREGGITAHAELAALVAALAAPRVVWVMLPAGDITEQALHTLATLMAKGDVLVDGGNANYKD